MSSDINVQTFSGKVNITSNLLVGSSHLFVDTTNNRVGLVTVNPQAGLHVNSNAYVDTDFRVGPSIVMNETTGLITAGSFVGDGSGLQGINSDSGSWVNGASSNVHLATIGDSVGIGVVDPQYKLDVAGDINITSGSTLRVGGTPAVFSNWTVNGSDIYRSSGNVGIGTTDPTVTLDVAGSATNGKSLQLRSGDIDSGTDSAQIIFSHSGNPYNSGGYAHSIRTRHRAAGDADNAIDFWCWNTTDTTDANTLGNKRVMTIEGTGKVGIGTTDPTELLDITAASGTDAFIRLRCSGGDTGESGLKLTESGEYGFQFTHSAVTDLLKIKHQSAAGAVDLDNIMVWNPNGNVGIGTDSPGGGLHVYGKTFILGEIASAPSGPDGTMYYNSTTNQPLVKVNGSWISLVNFLPSNISGLVGWYLPENWTGSQWTDASAAGNNVTNYEGTINYTASHSGSSVGANGTFPVIYGNTAAELNFPSAILPSTYTLISMTRYNGSTLKRILDGQNVNWLSGHWSGSSGVAYHNGWLTDQTNRHGSNWVIGVDQNSLYRSKSQSVAWTNDTGGGGSSTNLRLGSVGYEASEWMCAELIVYNRTLSSDEYTQLSDYMQNKYGIY